MGDVTGDVGLEGDVHRPRDVHGTFERQTEIGGNLRAGSVRADQVLGANAVFLPGDPVEYLDGDAVGVLGVGEVLGGEPGLGTALRRVAHQDRLKVGLRDVDGQAGGRETVIGLPVGACAPGVDPADLLTGDAGAEHGVADQTVLGGVRQYLVLDAEIAEHLHGPLVGDVRAGVLAVHRYFVIMMVSTPSVESSSAAEAPAGPEPTTTTSVVTVESTGSSVSAIPSLNMGMVYGLSSIRRHCRRRQCGTGPASTERDGCEVGGNAKTWRIHDRLRTLVTSEAEAAVVHEYVGDGKPLATDVEALVVCGGRVMNPPRSRAPLGRTAPCARPGPARTWSQDRTPP